MSERKHPMSRDTLYAVAQEIAEMDYVRIVSKLGWGIGDHDAHGPMSRCVFCNGVFGAYEKNEHADGCLWVWAREFVAEREGCVTFKATTRIYYHPDNGKLLAWEFRGIERVDTERERAGDEDE
jgi:hypothetical protein